MTQDTLIRTAADPAAGSGHALHLAGSTWLIDPVHSSVEFAVRHMMVATVRGRFSEVEGSLRFASDDVASGAVVVGIDAASIDTRTAQRDTHLRSPDFFDVERFPRLEYRSRRIERLDRERFRVVGDLTIRGETREVVLEATFNGSAVDPSGATRIGFSATGRLDRRDFGLTWNQALETGGILVGDEVRLTLDVQLVEG